MVNIDNVDRKSSTLILFIVEIKSVILIYPPKTAVMLVTHYGLATINIEVHHKLLQFILRYCVVCNSNTIMTFFQNDIDKVAGMR